MNLRHEKWQVESIRGIWTEERNNLKVAGSKWLELGRIREYLAVKFVLLIPATLLLLFKHDFS